MGLYGVFCPGLECNTERQQQQKAKGQFSLGQSATFVGVHGKTGKEYGKRYEITPSGATS